jgi:hypothetical protein
MDIKPILIVIIIVIVYYLTMDNYGKYGKSRLIAYTGPDGITYFVHRAHDNRNEALRKLINIQRRNITLLRHLKRNHANDPRAQRLLTQYNPDKIMENSPLSASGDTAYIIGKGTEFRMCLRRRDNQSLHSDQELTFVQLHEMAHIASISYDHDQEFWSTFKWLLERAVEGGVYIPVDYSTQPFTYCGLNVTYNPLFDDTITH